jgi:hypothetical protein
LVLLLVLLVLLVLLLALLLLVLMLLLLLRASSQPPKLHNPPRILTDCRLLNRRHRLRTEQSIEHVRRYLDETDLARVRHEPPLQSMLCQLVLRSHREWSNVLQRPNQRIA